MKVGHTDEDVCARAASIMAKLNHQRTQVHFCDCVIKGQDQDYTVHRCVLAASSPVFAAILHSGGILVELKAPCFSDSIMELLLDYIYTGTLPQLDNKQYSYLISAARYLEMDELQMTLKTKAERALGYYNTFDVDSKHTLLPSEKDVNRSPSVSLHRESTVQSEHHQNDTHWTNLSLDAGSKILTLNGGVSMKSKTDVNPGYIISTTSKLTGLSETDQTTHKLIQRTRSCGETQQISTMYQNKDQNLSGGTLKPDIWQEGEGPRSYSSGSTKTQNNQLLQDEKAHCSSLQENAKSEEVNPISETLRHDSYCCATSVIRYCHRITRTPEVNMSLKPFHDTSAFTGEKSEKSYCNTEKMETQNCHYDNQCLQQSAIPDHEYSTCSFNRMQNNEEMHKKHSVKASNNDQCDPDFSSKKFCQVQDMPSVTTINSIYSQDVNNVTPSSEQMSATFQHHSVCAKRKLKEESSDKSSKSAKTDLVDSAAILPNNASLYNYEHDTACKDGNTLNTTLNRSLSVSTEGRLNQFPCVGSVPSYSGHLFYHCESQTDRSSSLLSLSPNFSVTPREDNGTLSEEQVVLLDISSTSPETLVSYKQTSETGAHPAHNSAKANPDNEERQKSKDDYQGVDEGPRALCHEGAKIMTASLTGCTSACGKSCVHSLVSTSLSDHIPVSGMQTNISDPASSLVQHTFRCSLCERSFSQRGSLNRHMRSHLGVRPFPCPHCTMTFSRQYRVAEHMRVHQRSALEMNFPKPPAF